MHIYIINFILNIIMGIIILYSTKTDNSKKIQKRKKIYLILTTIQLTMLCGFRSTSVGWDTSTYKRIFEMASSSIENIFVNQTHVEIGFSVLCTLIKMLNRRISNIIINNKFICC